MSSSVPQRTQLRRLETFTGFTKLPPELRVMIWELALDRSRRTVHVYPLNENASSNEPNPETTSRATLNFILERELEICRVGVSERRGDATGDYEDEKIASGIDRGMWRACKESREIIKTNTIGTFEAYFDNYFKDRLDSVFDIDIIHLVRIPPRLDAVIAEGAEPNQSLMESVDEAIKSQNVFLIEYKPHLTHSSTCRAVWSFVSGFARIGQVFLIDYALKRKQPMEPGASVPNVIFEGNGKRFVEVDMHNIKGCEHGVLGQGDSVWKTVQLQKSFMTNALSRRFHIAACEYV